MICDIVPTNINFDLNMGEKVGLISTKKVNASSQMEIGSILF